MKNKNILITGRPGIGKTTLIRKIAERLGAEAGGFYSEEIRPGTTRIGFKVVDLEGREGTLARKDIHTGKPIGNYQVDVPGFEKIAIPAMRHAMERCRVIIIDEIGPMEEYSATFKKLLLECLDSDKTVIASIKEKGSRFVDQIKRREDVQVFQIDLANRDTAVIDILNAIARDGAF